MEYINAKSVLPQELIEELQRYVQGGYLYIPAAEERHRCWGELSGYKEMLRQRNAEFIVEYENGLAVDHLAEKYHLSEHTIRKILYQSRGS